MQNHKNFDFEWEVSQKSNFELRRIKGRSRREKGGREEGEGRVSEPSDTVRTRREPSTWRPKLVQNRPKIDENLIKNRKRKGFNIDL